MVGHCLVVDGQIAVAVENVKGFAELRECLNERAAGAEECRAVEAVVDFDAEAGAVAVEVDDLLTQVADAEDEVSEAGGFEQAKLVREKRFAGDLDEELGNFFGDGAEAGGHAAGKEGDGEGRGECGGEGRGRRGGICHRGRKRCTEDTETEKRRFRDVELGRARCARVMGRWIAASLRSSQ